MQRKYLTSALLLILLLSSSAFVQAELVLEAGVSLNTLNMNSLNQFFAYRNWEMDRKLTIIRRIIPQYPEHVDRFYLLNYAGAYNLTAEYWFDDLVAVTTELEIFHPLGREYIWGSNAYQERMVSDLAGVLPGVSFQFFADEQLALNLTANIGKYYNFLRWSRDYDSGSEFVHSESYSYQDQSLGVKAGAKIVYDLADDIALEGRVNYRWLKFDQLKNSEGQRLFNTYTGEALELDYSGLELRSIISIAF